METTPWGFRRRALAAFSAALLAITLLALAPVAPASAGSRSATSGVLPTDGAAFDPGFIISDFNFYDSYAMTEEQIDAFLRSVRCAPLDASPCLSAYRETTADLPAAEAGHCAAYRGGVRESAARILSRVAIACGISPRVLLVLLQKEQSLLTHPDARGYQRATGYACPDTADCDAEYFGFFNQVYNAAWQFRQYTQHPDRAYQVGEVTVNYSPDPACGAETVRIRNQATANLYNYTPYQPNDAALADLKGEGDACSSHGNLNFWLLYSKWFGDPTAGGYPAIFGPCVNLEAGWPCPAIGWSHHD